MRRGYVIALIVCVGAAGICGCLGRRSPANPGRLDAKLIMYRSEEDVVLAAVTFTMPSLPRITPATAPRLGLLFQTPGGWREDVMGASFGGSFFWHLQPGSTNFLTLALPPETGRWRLSLSLRESGWRDWFIHRLSIGGWWARNSNGQIRWFWPYVTRHVPNVAGTTMFFQSKVFSTRGPHKQPQKRHPNMWVRNWGLLARRSGRSFAQKPISPGNEILHV